MTRDLLALTCCSDGCTNPATETIFLRGQIGHVHDCPRHAAALREWCDVVVSAPILDGECLAVFCTAEPIGSGQPTPLDGGELP